MGLLGKPCFKAAALRIASATWEEEGRRRERREREPGIVAKGAKD